jgi:hypothetical protein
VIGLLSISRQTLSWWGNLIAPWLAPVLVCGIAITQIIYVQISALSPWKGGGFGMFSTVDSPGARFLRVQIVTPEGEIAVPVPRALRARARELRTVASERLAIAFAHAVSNGTWVKAGPSSTAQNDRGRGVPRWLAKNETPGPREEAITVKSVRVELWRYSFDRATTTLNARKYLIATSANSK